MSEDRAPYGWPIGYIPCLMVEVPDPLWYWPPGAYLIWSRTAGAKFVLIGRTP